MINAIVHRRPAARAAVLASFLGLLLLCLLLSRGAMAQEGQDNAPGGDGGPAEIQPGELLAISIDGLVAPGLEARLLRRVGAEGQLWLPVLDDRPITAGGMTPGELQAEIRRALARQSVRTDVVAVARVDQGEDQQLVVPQVQQPEPVAR